MKEKIKPKFKNAHNLNEKLVIDGLIVGFVAGVFSILYRFMLSKLDNLRLFLFNDIDSVIIVILSSIAIWFIVGKIIKREPLSSGSGYPKFKLN